MAIDNDRGIAWKYRWKVLRDSWLVLALLAGLVILIVIIGGSRSGVLSNSPVLWDEGEIVRFGSYATEIGERPTAIIRLRDGSTRQVRFPRSARASCKTGDRIALRRQDGAVFIDPLRCFRP